MATNHKVFISYYHEDDQWYKNEIEKAYGGLMISKSVESGDINEEVSTEYIKRLIREDFISDASVIMVLISPETRNRKHVDWEIYAGLSGQAGGHSGLFGVYLPELPINNKNQWDWTSMPDRYTDNRKSGYATYATWDNICKSGATFQNYIQTAFDNRTSLANKIVNSRIQKQRNS